MTPPRSYVREIETRWATLLERPVVLGERDWSVICDWHARGIPLALNRFNYPTVGIPIFFCHSFGSIWLC